jgi:NADPH:quinone reductase-like Zn-dependent oxidoreductase
MKAWQYTTTAGGLEQNLTLSDFPKPKASELKKNEILVKILSVGLNPADYKVPEMPMMKYYIGTPAIPCTDYSGRIEALHSSIPAEKLKVGDLVFGRLIMTRIGALGEYAIANLSGCFKAPSGVGIDDLAAIGTAGLTAHQSLVPYVKRGDKVFINGGSGGCGTFGIQIAKILGASVTTSCSSGNVELCKELGADVVINYKTSNVLEVLGKEGQVYDLVVDNVGDSKLYLGADSYMKPGAKYLQAGLPSGGFASITKNLLMPGFLGGGKRPFKFLQMSENAPEAFEQIARWIREGKMKAVIEQIFEFGDATKALAKVREGRTRGKIVVHVSKS